jgi:hypothetical protein
MSAPTYRHDSRPDTDVICIPNLTEWLGRIAQSDASIWASYIDYKAVPERVQK